MNLVKINNRFHRMLHQHIAQNRSIQSRWTFEYVDAVPDRVPALATPIPFFALVGILVGFGALAVGAIVGFSLIPAYMPKRTINVTCTSQPVGTTFNINDEYLPSGALNSNDLATIETALNTNLDTRANFNRCDVDIRQGSVDTCSSGQRLLQRRIRRGRDSFLIRQARQTNENCRSQQLDLSLVLDCGCKCVGRCLREKVQQLSDYLLLASFEINFPDLSNTTIAISGTSIPVDPSNTTTISSTTISTTTILTTQTTTSMLVVTPVIVG